MQTLIKHVCCAVIVLATMFVSCGGEQGVIETTGEGNEFDKPILVYFNKDCDEQHCTPGNTANSCMNLESKLVKVINMADSTIDFATYEINLDRIIDALMERAAQGIAVRLIVDAKDPEDEENIQRYDLMRDKLESMKKGVDDIAGTADDIHIFADAPIYENEEMLCDGERKEDGTAYGSAYTDQMHNKFVVVDNEWVWTGSWNFTVTGLYGSEEDQEACNLNGNANNSILLHSTGLAQAYTDEFNEMWGSDVLVPDPHASNFHGRKEDNVAHECHIGDDCVEVYMSPGDDALARVRAALETADHEVYFCIFSWSDQQMVDMLKNKWEVDGELTGFDIRGVFDSSFWNQYWSASLDMTGRESPNPDYNNPWTNPAPVYKDREDRKLHHKYMIIDAHHPDSDPVVITGSTNWSKNGNEINDENLLIIHSAEVANQYLQEFEARFANAAQVD
ncbi:MAG TPA: phospholipase D-like domain-containing protein [Patescibacteria group bacterium]|nr:phospholipase D-like domain-containing protein [Patescibacteria group bacterium]